MLDIYDTFLGRKVSPKNFILFFKIYPKVYLKKVDGA